MLAILRYSLLSFCLLLNSCATFELGVPVATVNYESEPAHDAIVGFWTRFTEVPGYSFQTIHTLYFSPDGTGFTRAKLSGYEEDIQEITNGKNFGLTWRYAGGGWWDANMESAGGHPNQDYKYRMATDPEAGMILYLIQDNRAVPYTKVSDP